MPIRKVVRLRAAGENKLAAGVRNAAIVRHVVNNKEDPLCQYMNINARFVTIDFLSYNGSAKAMKIYAAKNAGNQSRSNNFRPSHLPVVVNVVQPQVGLLQVVLHERAQLVKQSKTGCFTRIFIV
jgi:hypothetical protein